MDKLNKFQRDLLDYFEMNHIDLIEIEKNLKESIIKEDIPVKTWNMLLRGADAFGIDLTDSLNNVKSRIKRENTQKSLDNLYSRNDETIFNVLSQYTDIPVEELKLLDYTDIVRLSRELIDSDKLKVKDYNRVCRGLSVLENAISEGIGLVSTQNQDVYDQSENSTGLKK